MEHDTRRARERVAPQAAPVAGRGAARRVVQPALRRQRPLREARFLQVAPRAAHRRFGDRVAHQVFVALAAVDDQVVRIEMKAQVGRYVGQPVDRGLQPDGLALVEQRVEPRHAGRGGAKGLEAHAEIEPAIEAAHHRPGRHAIGNERQAVQPHERQVGEGDRRGEAEGHRLGKRHAVMAQERRHHARLAVRGMQMLEAHHSRRSSACGAMPSASA